MTIYSIAEAKNRLLVYRLPNLRGRAVKGKEVVITRRDKSVAGIGTIMRTLSRSTPASNTWQRTRRHPRKALGVNSANLLPHMWSVI